MRAAGLLALAAACADLPPITAGVCGNGIVDEGEQCDSFPDPGLGEGSLRCGPAGGIHACMYVCEADGDPACPSGWACAVDGRCRHASGAYDEASGSPHPFVANGLALGDVDGDEFPDLIGHRTAGLIVAFGSEDGALEGDIIRATDVLQGIPAFGNVDTGPTTDMVIPAASGLIGLRGQSDRTLSPIIYSSASFPDSPRFVVANFGESVPQLVVFRDTNMELYNEHNESIATLPLPNGHFAFDVSFDVPLLDIDASGEPEMFLALSGEDRIWVYTIETLQIVPAGEIALPGPFTAGPRLGDFNVDGLLDMMVAIAGGVPMPIGECNLDPVDPPLETSERVAVAWGNPLTGLDAFVVEPIFDAMQSNCCSFWRAWPIAVGLIDGDGLYDVVGDRSVCVQDGAGALARRFETFSFGWSQAGLADFNRDGYPDLAALDYQGLDLLLGNGTGLFSRYRTDFPTYTPTTLRLGDFDGDFFDDAAVGVGSDVQLFFGAVQGAPVGPISVSPRRGGFVNAVELAVLDGDLATDLVVKSEEMGGGMGPGGEPVVIGSSSLAFLRGNSQRSMLSPYVFDTGNGPETPYYTFLGRFDGAGDVNKDVVVFTHDNNAVDQHIWLLRGDGQGTLSPGQVVYANLPAGIQPQCMFWRSADLDADPATPDVLLGVTDASALDFCAGPREGESELHLLALDDSGGALSVSHVAWQLSGYLRGPSLVDLADVNGDALPDLIITFTWSVDKGGLGPGTAVYPNVAGAIDPGMPAVVNQFVDAAGNVLQGTFPVHAVPVNADGDPEKELAVLASGFRETDFTYIAGVFISDPDATGALPPEAHAVIELATFSATRLLSGDVNTDGLDDLLLFTGGDVHIYTARASQP